MVDSLPPRRAITVSRGITRLPGITTLLGVTQLCWRLPLPGLLPSPNNTDCVVGWGYKSNTTTARRYAARHQRPFFTLEDGFLRSVGLGVNGAHPLSLVVDDLGMYYDASRPSRLEHRLNGLPLKALPGGNTQIDLANDALLARARRCIDAIVDARLSKYNVSPEWTLPDSDRPRVLVVDQTAGDLSIAYGLADADRFHTMLNAARQENPHAQILIKTHPDVISGHKHGHFDASDADAHTQLLSDDINPIHLLEQVDKVYVVTSQLGFEALMVGRPVICFGAPFYSGWGLTDDRYPVSRRQQQRSVEQVFAAAYLDYARYLDPDSGQRCEIERVIEHLTLQRQWFKRNAGTWLGFGISWWKRWYVRHYLRSPWNRVTFYQNAAAMPGGSDPTTTRILVWGLRDTPQLRARAAACGYPIWRMEDGFLRSVGLGTDLTVPVSQVIDSRGIYFDPNTPSDLEHLLAHGQFDAAEQTRAGKLRERMLAMRLSKYNLHKDDEPLTLHAKPGQRIILVPGQVEDDAAIRLGCRDIHSNAQLLSEVRRQCPDAYILYKPHPDVLSRNRRADSVTPSPEDYDQLIEFANITTCLAFADEVHTLTSLVGFEALLRGKRVVTYGLPFYAGWGLTHDRHELPRRARRLNLDQLVAGVLIHYPRYINASSGEFTSPEQVIEQLGRALNTPSARLTRQGLIKRGLKSVNAFICGVGREWLTSKR